jgi:hypothetical protein
VKLSCTTGRDVTRDVLAQQHYSGLVRRIGSFVHSAMMAEACGASARCTTCLRQLRQIRLGTLRSRCLIGRGRLTLLSGYGGFRQRRGARWAIEQGKLVVRVAYVAGRPIPRLFSAGVLASSWLSLYAGAGNVTEALVFGRIAGTNAARLT